MYRIEALAIPGFREPVNCFSHLGGAAVFAVLAVFLVCRGRGSFSRIASLAVMAFSAVLMLSLSGVYHMLGVGTARESMERIDVAAVFVLIAGTATPIYTTLFTGPARWGHLVLVWCVAAAGITFRMVFYSSIPSGIGTGFFVMLGWGLAVSAIVLWRRYGFRFIRPLVAGGVAYSLGAVVLELHWPILIPGVVGPHEIWHAAVLAGLGLHWLFVSRCASGLVSCVGESAPMRSSDPWHLTDCRTTSDTPM